jgi:hypothetical protein
LGNNKDNQNIYNDFYASVKAHNEISYIVLLEMDRNRKLVRYEKIKDDIYFETRF